ncbi:MAG: hypothetical protein H7Z16_03135 [Pyrinomonadaceae bacterium]|nr:hypothetical protein [Pyrinomonadaceae bacterium]
MSRQYSRREDEAMCWMIEGDWYVFEQETTRPFELVKAAAARGLMQGLSGLDTSHHWEGTTCHISAPGAESKLTFDHGKVTCRLRISSFPAILFKTRILSDVHATTLDICGAMCSVNKNVFISEP